jgi:hypothetical protein
MMLDILPINDDMIGTNVTRVTAAVFQSGMTLQKGNNAKLKILDYYYRVKDRSADNIE